VNLMINTPVEVEQGAAAVAQACRQFTQLLRSAPDPAAVAVGSWTAAETAAHVAEIIDVETAMVEGRGSPAPDLDIAAFNAEHLRGYTERDPSRIADRVDVLAAGFVDAVRSRPAATAVAWHAGIALPLTSIVAVVLSEVLVHGFDVARAERRRWSIDRGHAALAIDGLAPLLPHYLDSEAAAGLSACFDVRVRGGSRHYYVIERGSLAIEAPSQRRVDCHVSADPTAFLLAGYRRVGQWGPAFRGQMIAWGRRPWLALRLISLLKNP
jgi:hypothetical protein